MCVEKGAITAPWWWDLFAVKVMMIMAPNDNQSKKYSFDENNMQCYNNIFSVNKSTPGKKT